jgi:hypothetical protein
VAAVNAAPVYGDYAAAVEQYVYDNAWHPSYLPAFDTAEQTAEDAYQEEVYYQQDEVMPVTARATYGAGFPHRSPWMDVDNAAATTVRNVSDEWWVPVHFPKTDYCFLFQNQSLLIHHLHASSQSKQNKDQF